MSSGLKTSTAHSRSSAAKQTSNPSTSRSSLGSRKEDMLTPEENERITRIGQGTPMGKYLRRFWWPLTLSTELPEPDGAPLRVRMMGEYLIPYRDTERLVCLSDAY